MSPETEIIYQQYIKPLTRDEQLKLLAIIAKGLAKSEDAKDASLVTKLDKIEL